MPKITFATKNSQKFYAAKTICAIYNIDISQFSPEIDEIQGEDPENIAIDKANKAFASLCAPVVIVDDTWNVPALKGFPGPYMKSMNKWFEPSDWLRLMNNITDRQIFMHQILVYKTETLTKVFSAKIPGIMLHSSRGDPGLNTSQAVISLDVDEGKSIAEVYSGKKVNTNRYIQRGDVWVKFAKWYSQ